MSSLNKDVFITDDGKATTRPNGRLSVGTITTEEYEHTREVVRTMVTFVDNNTGAKQRIELDDSDGLKAMKLAIKYKGVWPPICGFCNEESSLIKSSNDMPAHVDDKPICVKCLSFKT
jgi:hypothetical protein